MAKTMSDRFLWPSCHSPLRYTQRDASPPEPVLQSVEPAAEKSKMKPRLHWSAIVAVFLMLGGCVVYEPVLVPSPQTTQQRFDRAWSAASGAMYDQGLSITVQDRATGVIRGERGGVTITATLFTQADGSVQVKFSTSGNSADPSLIERVSASYDRRIGL
jgi:hypothetical protein